MQKIEIDHQKAEERKKTQVEHDRKKRPQLQKDQKDRYSANNKISKKKRGNGLFSFLVQPLSDGFQTVNNLPIFQSQTCYVFSFTD